MILPRREHWPGDDWPAAPSPDREQSGDVPPGGDVGVRALSDVGQQGAHASGYIVTVHFRSP